MKEIVVSGIRSTGNLHLGNYYGALRNFVKMQEESKYNSYFFIAGCAPVSSWSFAVPASIWEASE